MKVSIVQLNSKTDKKKNLDIAIKLANKAIVSDKPDLIAFPEMISFYGGTDEDSKSSAEDIPSGETTERLAGFAKKNGIFVHGGSFFEKAGNKTFNTSLAFNREGEIIAQYRKIHLFDAATPDGDSYRESDRVLPGDQVVTYQADGMTVGCTICYDLRFAELYLKLAKKGVDIIMIPAAFTLQTGKDHWLPLVRARAIETQAYVLAPAQCGKFPYGTGGYRRTWGHSVIVDPWGHVVSQIPDEIGWVSATIDPDYIRKIRTDMPISSHRIL